MARDDIQGSLSEHWADHLTLSHAPDSSLPQSHLWSQTVPRDAVTVGRQIGVGAFKTVHEGEYKGQKVAVLKLRAGTCDTEAAIFVKLGKRPGLVQYIGMCHPTAASNDQWLLVEFAPYGSLTDFLEDLEDKITLAHKVTILRQIASGMEALAEQGLVHRDLAARNVLVFHFDASNSEALRVKISDFGLSVRLIA